MKKLLFLFATGILLTTLAACGTEDSDNNSSEEDSSITIEHELGETKVDKNPENVVVFDYGILDTLDKLGIDVAGVPQGNIPSYLSDYDSDNYEDVGSLKEPDFEKIAEVDPDLIIISGRQSDVYDQLKEIAPTVYLGVDTSRYMESFKENMNKVGKIFDKQDEIDQELTKIDDSIEKLEKKAEDTDKNGLVILANEDKISAYGPGSRFGLIHDVFGIQAVDKNIEASTHGKNVSFEYVKEKNPDLLYVIDRGAAITSGEPSAKEMVENDLITDTNAYQNDDITYLDPEYWYLSGGGLVSVQEMIQEVSDSLD